MWLKGTYLGHFVLPAWYAVVISIFQSHHATNEKIIWNHKDSNNNYRKRQILRYFNLNGFFTLFAAFYLILMVGFGLNDSIIKK